MSEEYDPDKTLEEFGYSSKSTGKTIIIVLLVLLLATAGGALYYVGNLWSEEQSKALGLGQQIKTVNVRISELENKSAELSSLLADKQAETERMREEWTTQVETLKTQHKEQLQRTYVQMNEVVYDSRKTLAYIGDIETRLREGREIDSMEAAKLTSVINGLAFLHEQYKKPMGEFRELDTYFSAQLAGIPETDVDPLESTPLTKRIFKNKEFKEERAEFFQNQGKRSALTEARDRVSTAYSSAQQQMQSLSLNINTYLVQLDQIVDSTERSSEQIDAFFNKSKEILRIHDKIMSIEPPEPTIVKPFQPEPTIVKP